MKAKISLALRKAPSGSQTANGHIGQDQTDSFHSPTPNRTDTDTPLKGVQLSGVRSIRHGWSMSLDRQKEIVRTYSVLMDEVKSRLSWISYVVGGHSGLDPVVARESAHLQIRMICELVALGCLVAHGDIEEATAPKLLGMWNASALLKALEAVNPSFFPRPQAPPVRTTEGWHFPDVQVECLTKDQFVTLYGRSGDVLHRGNLKNLLIEKRTLDGEMVDVVAAYEALAKLLYVHRISMLDGSVQFVCLLEGDGGKVRTVFAGG